MKKYRFRITKRVQAWLLALLLVPFFSTCKEDMKDGDTEMRNVKVVIGSAEFTPELQSDGKTWVFFLPVEHHYQQSEVLKKSRVHFDLPKRATSVPGSGAITDLNNPANFAIFAEDGTAFVYTIDKIYGTSNKADIESFKLQIGNREIPGFIDEANSKIYVHVLTAMLGGLELVFPHITASAGATVTPRTGRWQDLAHWTPEQPVVCTYTVTSHDKTTVREYSLEIVEREDLGGVLEYFETDIDKSRTTFCAAIRRAGLEDLITGGDITCIVPDNDAWDIFLKSVDATSVSQVNPVLLKSVLQYLIFQGDHRLQHLTNENLEIETLANAPLWIRSNAANQIIINDNLEVLATLPVTVVEKDLWFENRVAAHVVSDFIIYKPIVATTDKYPDGYLPGIISLPVSDDSSIYGATAGVGTNYNTNSTGTQVIGRNGNTRYGVYKFPLTDVWFKDNIESATMVLRIYNIGGYATGSSCTLRAHELPFTGWNEETVTWTIVNAGITPVVLPTTERPVVELPLINEVSFVSKGVTWDEFQANPQYVNIDMTDIVKEYYAEGKTHLAVLTSDYSVNTTTANSALRFCDNTVIGYHTPIVLMGPQTPSALTLVRNNPVALSDGMATLDPDIHFAMTGPAVPDEYEYKDVNIIYEVKNLLGGIVTLYNVPLKVGERFTQAEMSARVVKYLLAQGASGSFVLSVHDYLDRKYDDDLTIILQ